MKPILHLRTSLRALAWLLTPGSPLAYSAGLLEPFSYSNGNLTTVSGGAWQLWAPGAGNATVVNGAARFEDTTDVIRTFPAVLTAPGQSATFSFTLNIAAANSAEGYEVAFEPSSAPFGSANTNYGSGLALGFDYLTGPTGLSTIQVAEGSGVPRGDNGGNTIVQVGTMSAGVTHSISITLTRGASNTAYSLFLDNTLLRSSTFVLNDSRAINALEFDQAGAPGDAGSFATIDNINIVPEPASCALLALGCAALLNVRRRRNSF
jgi:hypothetical protein